MNVNWVDVVFRWIHIGGIAVLFGGSVYQRFVVLPALKGLPDEAEIRQKFSRCWNRLLHPAILLILVSGFYNYLGKKPPAEIKGIYHMLVGIKILLALAVFFLVSVLNGKSKAFEGMRAKGAFWAGFTILLATSIVCISGFLKVLQSTVSLPIQ